MARNISQEVKRAIYASQTSEIFLELVEIDHTSLDAPLRFVANNEDIISNGNLYSKAAFKYELPGDADGVVNGMTLTICNVDRKITEIIRTISGTPIITFSIVMASDMDQIEYGPLTFKLDTTTYTALTISATLTSGTYMDDNASTIKCNVKTFPGNFQ
jgi:hypothetical protein